jgi:hypothetical protein
VRRQAEADRIAAETNRREQEEREQREAADVKRRQAADRLVAEAKRREQEERERHEADAKRCQADEEWRRREAAEAEKLRREATEAEERQREAAREAAASAEERDIDEIVPALVALKKRYKEDDPKGLLTCLQTLRAYISNLAKSPQEAKFQRINCDNGAFKTRVAAFDGAFSVLRACGFEEEGRALVVGPVFLRKKGPRLFDALAKVDVVIAQVQSSSS